MGNHLKGKMRAAVLFIVIMVLMLTAEAVMAAVKVSVGIDPVAWLAESIGGEYVDVEVLLEPGSSPATYDPSPRQVADLAEAEVYFLVGVPFELNLMNKTTRILRNLQVCDLRYGITMREFSVAEGHDHGDEHTSAGDHNHAEGHYDPHIWLDPQLMKIMAHTIVDELKRLDSTHADIYEQNLVVTTNQLERLDLDIREILAGYGGRSFYVFHPSFGYFADRYNLKQVAIERSGREPGPKYLVDLARRARGENIRHLFIQRQFATNAAYAIAAEIGADAVPLDPLAKNYIDNMRSIARTIANSFDYTDKQE